MATRPRPQQGGAKGAVALVDQPAHTIFVSYSHDDPQDAQDLVDELKPLAKGRSPCALWVDSREIKAGDEWEQLIYKGLEEASVFVVLLSRNFRNSKFCMEQELPFMLRKAKNKKTIIIGVLLHELKLTDFEVSDPETSEWLSMERHECVPKDPPPPKPGGTLIPLIHWKERVTGLHQIRVQIEAALTNAPADPDQSLELKLPYWCNRDTQLSKLSNDIVEWQNQGRRRPLVLLHQASYSDCPTEWVERLALHEIHQALRRPGSSQSPEFIFGKPRYLAWPSGPLDKKSALAKWRESIGNLVCGSRSATLDDIFSTIIHPGKWFTYLPLGSSPDQAELGLGALLEILSQWPDLPERPAAPQIFSVYLLLNEHAPYEVHEWLKFFKQKLKAKHKAGALCWLDMDSLGPIKMEHLDDWKQHPLVSQRLRSEIESLRAMLKIEGIPMRSFAQAYENWAQQHRPELR